MVSSSLHPVDLEHAIVPHPLIVAPHTPLLDVLALMTQVRETDPQKSAQTDKDLEIKRQNKERSSCVLIVGENQLAGILTERDLLKCLSEELQQETVKVEDIMTPDPIVLMRSRFLDPFSVLSLFRQYDIRHLPIIGQKKEILGLVTPATIRQILQPADLLRMRSVSEVMETDRVWGHPDTPILEIARLMTKHNLTYIPIVQKINNSSEDIKPLGTIAERDLVQFQASGFDFQDICAAEIMRYPQCISSHTSLWQAHRQMQTSSVRCLIVTGERGELLGSISQMEILQTIEPWAMYETIDNLRDRICQLENEKLQILKQQNLDLEQQVSDRTKQLQEVNQQLQAENQERRLLTKQLQQAETTLRSLFQAMDDVVMIVHQNTSNIQIIPTAPFLDQSDETDIINKTIDGFWGNSPFLLEPAAAVLEMQKSMNFEYSLGCDRSDELHWFTAKIIPLSDNEVLWIARDTSDRKKDEAALQQRIQERTIALKALALERNLVTKILNVAGALIVVCARDGRILRFNQTCEQITGYQVDEILGFSVWDKFLIPEDIESVKHIFQQLQAGKIPDRSENYWLTKTGQKRLISWSNTILTDDKGQVEYIIGTGIDITELREAERALRSSEEKFRHLANNIRDVFFIREAQTFQFLYISPAFAEIWQIPCEKVYQNLQLWFNSIHPEDRDRLKAAIQSNRKGFACDEIFRILRPDGEIRWIWERGFPVSNEKGKVETIVSIAEDITERKQAEFIAQQAEISLKEVNEELEKRVAKRTAQLQETNEQLTQEILQRQTAEEALWESEEELRDLFNNANDLIQSISLKNGRILYVNPAWLETLDYRENEIEKLSIFDLIAPKSKHFFKTLFQQLKTGEIKKTDCIELTLLTKKGRPVILEGSINTRCLDSGLSVSTRGIFRDITDRKQAEEQLKQQLSAIETAADGIAILQNNTYTYLNQAHANMFGYDRPRDLIGKTWQEVYSNEENQRFQKDIFPILERKKFWRGEATAKRKNGSFFPEEVSLTLAENGILICVCQDITERKKAESEILQSLIKEQELNDLKSRFISMTSHEFRTPLAVISSSAGILKSFSHKLSEAKKQEHLQTIQTYVKHTTQLLDDILTINRAESGKMSFHPQPIALLEFCQTLIQEIQISSDRHQIFFTYNTTNEIPIHEICVLLDKKILRQILMNLLSNAIKYSPDGGKIACTLQISDRQIELQVRDSGIGIPESERESLFDSFSRASNVGTIQGTGLGLSIVKKCIDLHGGKIHFSSEINQGTNFTVCLPYHPL